VKLSSTSTSTSTFAFISTSTSTSFILLIKIILLYDNKLKCEAAKIYINDKEEK